MKCPLITAGFWADPNTSGKKALDCLQKECAWWDSTAERCAVLQLTFELDDVHCQLEGLIKKMPHEEQFRR